MDVKSRWKTLTRIGGHPGYFGFIAEMKNPEDFPKSLCMQQGFEILLYTVSAAVIYRFAGEGVASPALGSTGPDRKSVV